MPVLLAENLWIHLQQSLGTEPWRLRQSLPSNPFPWFPNTTTVAVAALHETVTERTIQELLEEAVEVVTAATTAEIVNEESHVAFDKVDGAGIVNSEDE